MHLHMDMEKLGKNMHMEKNLSRHMHTHIAYAICHLAVCICICHLAVFTTLVDTKLNHPQLSFL